MQRWPRGRRGTRPRLWKRIAHFVRALFGGGSGRGWLDDADGGVGVGVREPRRPLTPSLSGAATLELPADEPGEAH